MFRGLVRIACNLCLAVLAALVSLLFAEAVVRLVAPQQLILLRPDVWTPADRVGWRLRPGLDTLINTGERVVRVRTDPNGHRIGDDPDRDAEVVILALGDSFLAALQVEFDETMTERLRSRLSARLDRQVEVVNSGVGGWGPSHYLIELERELERRHYDLVLVFLFAGNDVEGKWVREFPLKQSTVRHRLRAPRALTLSELKLSVAYPINDFLETRSQLFMLVRNRAWFMLMRLGLSARRFPDVLIKEEATLNYRWAVTSDICKEIEQRAVRKGVPILFVLLPGVYQVDREIGRKYAEASGVAWEGVDLMQPSRLLGELFKERGLILLDTLDPLRAAGETRSQRELFGNVDTHLAPEGHRVVAEQLIPSVIELLESAAKVRQSNHGE